MHALFIFLTLALAGGFTPLTDKDIDQMAKFWPAVAKTVKSDPALQKRLAEKREKQGSEGGEKAMVQIILGEPKLKKALDDSGMKPDRFGPALSTFVGAVGVVELKRTGQMKDYPPDLKAAAQLVEKRSADVEKVVSVMKELDKLAGNDDR